MCVEKGNCLTLVVERLSINRNNIRLVFQVIHISVDKWITLLIIRAFREAVGENRPIHEEIFIFEKEHFILHQRLIDIIYVDNLLISEFG